MIDVQTDAGFAAIKWVSPPSDLKDKQWACHEILHDGDGPLSWQYTALAGCKSLITPSEASVIAAKSLVSLVLFDCGDTETIKIAVHLGGDEYARYDVTAKVEAVFDAREI